MLSLYIHVHLVYHVNHYFVIILLVTHNVQMMYSLTVHVVLLSRKSRQNIKRLRLGC